MTPDIAPPPVESLAPVMLDASARGTVNYRCLSDRELAEIAEDRIAHLKQFIPCGSHLWEEVLYRLRRARGGDLSDKGTGERQGVLILT